MRSHAVYKHHVIAARFVKILYREFGNLHKRVVVGFAYLTESYRLIVYKGYPGRGGVAMPYSIQNSQHGSASYGYDND